MVDQTVEQPIECDALLPDYCPDIGRILKCAVAPTLTGRRASPGKLELEGMAVITVYYVSTGEGVARGEYKVPFSRIVEMKADHPAPVLSLLARVDYVNCRAVNQRRLDIRGALVLSVKATGSREEQVTAEGEGMGLQLKREQADATRLLGQCVRDTHLTEKVELTHGKPPIQAVIRSKTPTLFIHGVEDDFVPASMMGKLYQTAGTVMEAAAKTAAAAAGTAAKTAAAAAKAGEEILKNVAGKLNK